MMNDCRRVLRLVSLRQDHFEQAKSDVTSKDRKLKCPQNSFVMDLGLLYDALELALLS